MVENQKEEDKIEQTDDEALGAMLDKAAPHIKGRGMTPWVFANDKTNPAPFGLLDMFYAGVITNTLGIMVAKDSETGDEVAILVGLSKNEEGEPSVYPVARIIGAEAAGRYLPPDGNGGYIEVDEAGNEESDEPYKTVN